MKKKSKYKSLLSYEWIVCLNRLDRIKPKRKRKRKRKDGLFGWFYTTHTYWINNDGSTTILNYEHYK